MNKSKIWWNAFKKRKLCEVIARRVGDIRWEKTGEKYKEITAVYDECEWVRLLISLAYLHEETTPVSSSLYPDFGHQCEDQPPAITQKL